MKTVYECQVDVLSCLSGDEVDEEVKMVVQYILEKFEISNLDADGPRETIIKVMNEYIRCECMIYDVKVLRSPCLSCPSYMDRMTCSIDCAGLEIYNHLLDDNPLNLIKVVVPHETDDEYKDCRKRQMNLLK